MNWFSIAWNFIKDPKNQRLLGFIGIIIFVILYFIQLNITNSLRKELDKQKLETQRIQNNFDVSRDTIKQYITSNGALKSEFAGYVLTIDELNEKYSNIFKEYTKEKNKSPKVVIEYNEFIKEVIKEVPVNITSDSLGNGILTFSDSVVFSEGNSRVLEGNIPFYTNYWLKKDTSSIGIKNIPVFSTITPKNGTFELTQNMIINTGLSINESTKKPIIWCSTHYPGVNFTKIVGAEILQNEDSKKVAKNLRKEFGIGMHIGYGVVFQNNKYNVGPVISIGLSYIPKFLQFGK